MVYFKHIPTLSALLACTSAMAAPIGVVRRLSWALGLGSAALLTGCLGDNNPRDFDKPLAISPGFWQKCMKLSPDGYHCYPVQVRMTKNSRIVVRMNGTSKGKKESVFVFQLQEVGDGLYLLQQFHMKDESTPPDGKADKVSYGFAYLHQGEFVGAMPNCKKEEIGPMLAAMGLKVDEDPCELAKVRYTHAEIAGIMRRYAARTSLTDAWRFHYTKLGDKEGQKQWQLSMP
jgi:hypothetical protein